MAPWDPQLPVLQAFASQWQATTLKIYGSTREQGPFIALELPAIRLIGQKLMHLEVADRALTSLQPLTACTAMQCLSLRGSHRLHSLEGLPQLAELCSLDIAGLSQLSQDSALHIARLPHLVALNVSRTILGDALLDDLTYGLRLVAWTLTAGQPIPPELASWPCSGLQRLHMRNCLGLTAQGLRCLELLPDLRFLDARGSGLANREFVPLQRRYALSSPQGAVLTNSNALLSAFVGRDAVDCACGGAQLSAQPTPQSTHMLQAEGVKPRVNTPSVVQDDLARAAAQQAK
eukprot:jgi/Astpho2/9389/Aster-x1576